MKTVFVVINLGEYYTVSPDIIKIKHFPNFNYESKKRSKKRVALKYLFHYKQVKN